MKRIQAKTRVKTLLTAAVMVMAAASAVSAFAPVSEFNLTAKTGYISTPDGGAYYMWGFGLDGGIMQYVGPMLDVYEGDNVVVNLTNELTAATSIVFPGQTDVTAAGPHSTASSPRIRARICITAARTRSCRSRWG